MKWWNWLMVGLVSTVLLPWGSPGSASGAELVVYSARKQHLIEPVFSAFTRETGIRVKALTASAGALHERLRLEGDDTPADLLLTVDAGNLWRAATAGLLRPLASNVLRANIPPHLRDPQNRWFGLSMRARTIVYSSDRVKPRELRTYEALGEERWRGRLVLRTAKKVYNQSLAAMLILDHGEAKAEEIVRAWVRNLATAPLSSDTKVLEALVAGVGDVGIVNTYYLGRLLKKEPGLPLAIFWPNQERGGVHVNVSGAGITTHAPHPEEAVRLLEWLSSPKAQKIFADANMEYPVNEKVEVHPLVAAWGTFKASSHNVSAYGELQAKAMRLLERAGYR